MRDLGPSPRSPRDEEGSEPLLQEAFLDHQSESPSGSPAAPERQTYQVHLPGSNESLENDSSCNGNEAACMGEYLSVYVSVCECVRVCVCVCVREREREKERARERAREKDRESVCACVRVACECV